MDTARPEFTKVEVKNVGSVSALLRHRYTTVANTSLGIVISKAKRTFFLHLVGRVDVLISMNLSGAQAFLNQENDSEPWSFKTL